MKMRSRRTFFALVMGLLLAPLLLLSAQPASAQRYYGQRRMAVRQFRQQRGQATHTAHAQQGHPQGSGAHPNANPGGNQGGNANHPNGAPGGAAGASSNPGGQHPNGNNFHPPANGGGAAGAAGANGAANGRAGVNGQDAAKLPGPWVQRLGQMSPQEQEHFLQEHFLQNNERFRS